MTANSSSYIEQKFAEAWLQILNRRSEFDREAKYVKGLIDQLEQPGLRSPKEAAAKFGVRLEVLERYLTVVAFPAVVVMVLVDPDVAGILSPYEAWRATGREIESQQSPGDRPAYVVQGQARLARQYLNAHGRTILRFSFESTPRDRAGAAIDKALAALSGFAALVELPQARPVSDSTLHRYAVKLGAILGPDDDVRRSLVSQLAAPPRARDEIKHLRASAIANTEEAPKRRSGPRSTEPGTTNYILRPETLLPQISDSARVLLDAAAEARNQPFLVGLGFDLHDAILAAHAALEWPEVFVDTDGSGIALQAFAEKMTALYASELSQSATAAEALWNGLSHHDRETCVLAGRLMNCNPLRPLTIDRSALIAACDDALNEIRPGRRAKRMRARAGLAIVAELYRRIVGGTNVRFESVDRNSDVVEELAGPTVDFVRQTVVLYTGETLTGNAVREAIYLDRSKHRAT